MKKSQTGPLELVKNAEQDNGDQKQQGNGYMPIKTPNCNVIVEIMLYLKKNNSKINYKINEKIWNKVSKW